MFNLKELRLEKGLSQRAIAKKIVVSQKSIDNWEKGKIEPVERNVLLLADFFGVTVDYLCGRENENGVVEIYSDLDPIERDIILSFRKFNESNKKELLSFLNYLKSKQ